MKTMVSAGVSLVLAVLLMAGCRTSARSMGAPGAAPGQPGGAAGSVHEIADGATLSGTVKFEGDAPRVRKNSAEADGVCHKAHPEGVPSESMLVGKDGGLANVVVWLKGGVNGTFEAPKTPALLNQEGCVYKPHVVTLMVGQTLEIKNSDGTAHNVHTLSKLNPEMNFAQPAPGSENKTFGSPEIFKVKCDIHGWMSAVVGVFKHPFFAVSDADGKFEIKGLPDGEYVVEAWHEKLGKQEGKVKISGGAAQTLDFSFSDEE